jgi:hypothetical protein
VITIEKLKAKYKEDWVCSAENNNEDNENMSS